MQPSILTKTVMDMETTRMGTMQMLVLRKQGHHFMTALVAAMPTMMDGRIPLIPSQTVQVNGTTQTVTGLATTSPDSVETPAHTPTGTHSGTTPTVVPMPILMGGPMTKIHFRNNPVSGTIRTVMDTAMNFQVSKAMNVPPLLAIQPMIGLVVQIKTATAIQI